MDNNGMAKKNTWIILALIIVIILAIIIGIIIVNLSSNNKGSSNDTNEDINTVNNINEDINTIDNSNEDTTNSDENSTISLQGLKGDTLDYYYNIDTSKFDKSKYDGKVYFYGLVIDGVITSNALSKQGVLFKKAYATTYLDETAKLNYAPQDTNAFSAYADVYYNSLCLDVGTSSLSNEITDTLVDFIDYTCTNDMLFLDTTYYVEAMESYGFNWNLKFKEVYPNILGVSSASDINIDLVIDVLGNPTYVKDRTDDCTDEYSYTVYIYVYDDVAYLFSFYNWKNLQLAGLGYYPIEQVTTYGNENEVEELKKQYEEYINNIS